MSTNALVISGVIAIVISRYLIKNQRVLNKSPETCPSADTVKKTCTVWSEGTCQKGHLEHVTGGGNPVCTRNGHNLEDILGVGGTLALLVAALMLFKQKFGHRA